MLVVDFLGEWNLSESKVRSEGFGFSKVVKTEGSTVAKTSDVGCHCRQLEVPRLGQEERRGTLRSQYTWQVCQTREPINTLTTWPL